MERRSMRSRRPVRRALLAVLLAILCPGVAIAAPLNHAGDPDQFRRDIDEINRKPPPEGEALARAVGGAVAGDAQQRGRCAPTKISLGKLEPVTLDGSITAMIEKSQIENAWLVSVKLDNCPPADPIRVLLFRATDGQRLQAMFAGQGESLAWPTLLREALKASVAKAVERLRISDPKCAPRELAPIGIRVAERSPDFGPSMYGIRLKGWWSEVWAFEPCAHKLAVPIKFTTDGKGGAYWDIDTTRIVFVP